MGPAHRDPPNGRGSRPKVRPAKPRRRRRSPLARPSPHSERPRIRGALVLVWPPRWTRPHRLLPHRDRGPQGGTHLQEGARPRGSHRGPRPRRRPRGPDAHLQQLPRLRRPTRRLSPRGQPARPLERWGSGLASPSASSAARQELHTAAREDRIGGLLSATEASLAYTSCWSANDGRASRRSSSRGGRRDPAGRPQPRQPSSTACRAVGRDVKRLRPDKHGDLAGLRARRFVETRGAQRRAPRTSPTASSRWKARSPRCPSIVDLCAKRYDALLVVDDSHATGVLGATGRGSAEETGVHGKVAVFTSTLGKAMGSAAGGFTTCPAPLVEFLRQRSRTTLFSNALPPPSRRPPSRRSGC